MILESFKLDGRVALVTGAAQGLGQGMALALAEGGADIVALDRCNSDETGDLVTTRHRRFSQLCVDLLAASVADLTGLPSMPVSERSDGSTSWSTTPASSAAPPPSTLARKTGTMSSRST